MKMKMYHFKALVLYLVVLFLFTGCIEEPEFKGASDFKLDEINKEHVMFNVDVSVFNPNGYALKVRKSTFDLYIDDLYIGEAKLLDKYKMKRKSTTLGNVPVEIVLQDGMMLKLMRFVSKKSVNLRLKGTLKASVLGIPNKQEIDQTKTVNLKDLNINLGGMLGK